MCSIQLTRWFILVIIPIQPDDRVTKPMDYSTGTPRDWTVSLSLKITGRIDVLLLISGPNAKPGEELTTPDHPTQVLSGFWGVRCFSLRCNLHLEKKYTLESFPVRFTSYNAIILLSAAVLPECSCSTETDPLYIHIIQGMPIHMVWKTLAHPHRAPKAHMPIQVAIKS